MTKSPVPVNSWLGRTSVRLIAFNLGNKDAAGNERTGQWTTKTQYPSLITAEMAEHVGGVHTT